MRDDAGMRAGWGVWLAMAVLVFAPLVRGGNRPLALMVLELAALGLLAAVALRPHALAAVPVAMRWALGALVLWSALQLLPLPFEWWARLPGRSEAAAAMAAAGVESAWMPMALVPLDAEQAVWALLPPVALFWLVVGQEVAQVRRLVGVFVAVATFQAVLGLMQYGAGPESALRFGYEFYGDSAIGTYANRSHLAGMLGMALPIALGLLAAAIFGLSSDGARKHGGWLARFKGLASGGGKTNRVAVWSVVCVALLLGIVFARSRTGIAVGMVGLVLTALLLMRNFGGGFAARMMGAVAGLGVTLAVAVGLAPVFARFGLDATQDARWPMLATTLETAWRFFPLGSGPGTFVEVFRGVHPDSIGGEAFINHAHNDFAEWWLEGGVPAAVLLLAFTVLYGLRWRQVWAVRNWEALHMMQVGAGVGLLMLTLFGLTDYNLRIPANQIYFALLAAVFFHPGEASAARRGERRRVSRPSPSDQGGVPQDIDARLSEAKRNVGGWDGGGEASADKPGHTRPPLAPGSNPFAE